jgi:hypothetical protein
LEARSDYLGIGDESFDIFSCQGLFLLVRIDSPFLVPVLAALLDIVNRLNLSFDDLLSPLPNVIWPHDIAMFLVIEIGNLSRGMLNVMKVRKRV